VRQGLVRAPSSWRANWPPIACAPWTRGPRPRRSARASKPASREQIAALDAESAAAKADLSALQKDLLAVLTKDDPAALKLVRARLAARQAALDAAEGGKTLILKEVEETERERDIWKKRAATLELALRMDMKVMLAGPADVGDREKRVDGARKDIDNQAGADPEIRIAAKPPPPRNC